MTTETSARALERLHMPPSDLDTIRGFMQSMLQSIEVMGRSIARIEENLQIRQQTISNMERDIRIGSQRINEHDRKLDDIEGKAHRLERRFDDHDGVTEDGLRRIQVLEEAVKYPDKARFVALLHQLDADESAEIRKALKIKEGEVKLAHGYALRIAIGTGLLNLTIGGVAIVLKLTGHG